MTDVGESSFSSLAGKVKVLKSHYENFSCELNMKSLNDSWQKEPSNSVKLLESKSFQDSDSSGILEQPVTLVEVDYVVKEVKNNQSAGSDGTVNDLIKYRCKPICEMWLALFTLV